LGKGTVTINFSRKNAVKLTLSKPQLKAVSFYEKLLFKELSINIIL